MDFLSTVINVGPFLSFYSPEQFAINYEHFWLLLMLEKLPFPWRSYSRDFSSKCQKREFSWDSLGLTFPDLFVFCSSHSVPKALSALAASDSDEEDQESTPVITNGNGESAAVASAKPTAPLPSENDGKCFKIYQTKTSPEISQSAQKCWPVS